MKRVLVALTVLCLLTGATQAAPTEVMNLAQTGVGNQGWQGTLGVEFNVLGSNFTVYQLGVYDSGGDGIQGGKTLTTVLFDYATRDVLAQATFDATSGAAPIDYYLFKNVDGGPIVLAPGQYGLVSYGFDADNLNHNINFGGPGAIMSPDLALVSSIYSSSVDVASAGFIAETGNRYDGPNMTFTVPAPGALLLGMFGTGLLGWLRSRRSL